MKYDKYSFHPKKYIHATLCALSGLCAAFRKESAFVAEVIFAVIILPIPFWLDTSPVEKVLMIACIMLVLIVELINSAIESITDRVSTEQHPLSKDAKDMGGAAVLLSIINLFTVWGVMLWYHAGL